MEHTEIYLLGKKLGNLKSVDNRIFFNNTDIRVVSREKALEYIKNIYDKVNIPMPVEIKEDELKMLALIWGYVDGYKEEN